MARSIVAPTSTLSARFSTSSSRAGFHSSGLNDKHSWLRIYSKRRRHRHNTLTSRLPWRQRFSRPSRRSPRSVFPPWLRFARRLPPSIRRCPRRCSTWSKRRNARPLPLKTRRSSHGPTISSRPRRKPQRTRARRLGHQIHQVGPRCCSAIQTRLEGSWRSSLDETSLGAKSTPTSSSAVPASPDSTLRSRSRTTASISRI